MSHSRILQITLKAILVMASFVFISCEKSLGELGLDLVIDSKSTLGTKKSYPVKAYNILFDSIKSTGASQEIAGNYIDPYLGGVEAKFNTHLLLTLLNPNFGDEPVCDSVVLFLAYKGYYGDTNQPVTLVVNELGEYIDPDSSYYSNTTFNTINELGRTTQMPRPKTVVVDQGDTISPAIKIYLDKNYFQSKIIDAANHSEQHFTDNDAFINYMYGMQIKAEGNADGLLYFNVSSLASYINIYYRESPSDTVSEVYKMIYGGVTTSQFSSTNLFAQDFTLGGPDLANQDTALGESTLYCQAMGGAAPKVVLPNLKHLLDSNWIINRAELVFPVREGSVGKFPLPTSILLVENRPDRRVFIDDYATNGISVDGVLHIGELRDKKYTFNITRLTNRLINTTDTIYPLILTPAGSASNGWRAVLNGNTDPVNPMHFNIYYTKTKK